MFTGIIEDLGTVESTQKGSGLLRLQVKSGIFLDQKVGASISVNGACLTISGLKRDVAYFDVMEETQTKSNLGLLKKGDRVNLERAIKAGDRLSGHFVTGHIDCRGEITEKAGNEIRLKVPKEHMKYVVPKGSVALDGVSLTVAGIGMDNFTVCLIPHTIKNTTLGFKKVGGEVNVEFDILGKYALKAKSEPIEKSKITEDFLKGKGFY